MSEKEFVINLLVDSLKDSTSRNFTIEKIINILKTSTKIDNNEQKLNEFLNLKIENLHTVYKGFLSGDLIASYLTITSNLKYPLVKVSDLPNELINNQTLDSIKKILYIEDDKTLYDIYIEKNPDKLIKSGKYELLFIRNPLAVNEYDARFLAKVIHCDDHIKKELLELNHYSDEHGPGIYNFCFPEDQKDELNINLLVLKGEFQIWESVDYFCHTAWIINHFHFSQINDVHTTYVCDSEVIYPTDQQIIEYLGLK